MRAPSPSFSAEREIHYAGSRLGNNRHLRADHRDHRAWPASGHLPPAGDPQDARRDHRRRAGGRAAHQHRAGAAHLGQREPEAGARLLRNGLIPGIGAVMEPHVLAAGTSTTGWVVGYTIGIVIVLVVVALVVPILLLARAIGNEAPK